MSIKINIDNGTAESFTIILSSRDHRHFGEITNVSELKYVSYLNKADELSFNVNRFTDGKEERLWNQIIDLRLIYVKEINTYFVINIALNESSCDKKIITAKSLCECELSQKYLYDIEINTEADIARDDYVVTQFYNPLNLNGSLLHRILSEMPAYSIKHVDQSLMTMQRSFSINEKSIYDFMTNDCAAEFGCIFLFDSVERTISVHDLYTICSTCGHRGDFSDTCPKCGSHNLKYFGEDTTILVSADNLTDEIQFETDIDNVKNCFRLEAGDDIITAAVMSYIPSGGNKIFYVSQDQQRDMPAELTNKIRAYNILYDSCVTDYHRITEQIYECIERITYHTSKQMPDITIPDTTAKTEAAKLTIANLNPLSLSSLSSYTSLATVNSALINYAKVYVRSGFVKIEVDSGSFKYNGVSNGTNSGIWMGRFKVTNYSNKEDIAYSDSLTITINDDYPSFINEKILKNIALNNTDDNSVYNVLGTKELTSFRNALKSYCLNRLISFRDAINSVLSIILEANGGNVESDLYIPFYSKYYEKLQACNAEISARKSEIKTWEQKKELYESQKMEIQKALDFKTYLGEKLYNIFTTYIRESKYTNANYISDGLSDDAIFKRAQEFMEIARKELIKSSYYQHNIHTNMYNLLLMDEFSPIVNYFELGNWIRVKAGEDIYRLRLVSYEIDFDNLNTINTTFSDVTISADGMNDVHDILKQASSMAHTYAYVSKQASNGCKAETTIEKIRTEGLDSALYQIKNSDSEEITFGKNGILARSYDDISDTYSDKQLLITHNILAYTTDQFRSVKCALGEMKLTVDGKTTYEYGLNSDFCVSSKIIAGNIYSANYSSTNLKGTRFNLDNGTFTLADGKIVFDGDKLKLRGIEIDWTTTNESTNMWESINANSAGIREESERAINAEDTLSARVTLNKNNISLETQRAAGAESKLGSKIDLTAEELRLEAKDTKKSLEGAISLTAGEIRAEVSQTYETKTNATAQYNTLNSSISQTTQEIATEVTRATKAEGTLSTKIQQNADQVVLKADANGRIVKVSLGANASTGSEFKVTADNIKLTANEVLDIISGGTLNLTSKNMSIKSDNFSVDSKGNVKCTQLEAVQFTGQAVEQLNKAIFDSKTMQRVNEIIELFDKRMNDVETLLTNNKVLFDYLDAKEAYWSGSTTATSVKLSKNTVGRPLIDSIDCTGYKKCIVRVNGNIDITPGGASVNNTYLALTFSNDPETNNPNTPVINVVRKWNDTSGGAGQDGPAYNTWYDAIIDISELTGTHTLNCFAYGAIYANGGQLWVSKITLSNQ